MNLEWAVSSSVVILAVLAIRATLGKRISAWLRYALWGVVLLRLLVPVQLFSVPAGERLNGQEPAKSALVLSADSDAEAFESSDAGKEDGTGGTPDRFSEQEKRNPISPTKLLEGVWIFGGTVTALTLVWANLRFTRKLRKIRRPLSVGDRPPVYVAEGLPSPCLFGLLRPTIYITPDTAKDLDVLRHVLAHERTHYRHLDFIWSALRALALAIHWWNPLAWVAVRLSKQDGELACDEGTLRNLGDAERASYGAALLSLVTVPACRGELFSCATTMTGSKRELEERVQRIAKAPKRAVWAVAIVVLLTALTTVCAFTQTEDGTLNLAVHQAILCQNNFGFAESGVYIDVESHKTIRTVAKNGTVTVYAWVLVERYAPDDSGSLSMRSGSSMLHSYTFEKTGEGYVLRASWHPEDGNLYMRSIRENCPASVYWWVRLGGDQSYIHELLRSNLEQATALLRTQEPSQEQNIGYDNIRYILPFGLSETDYRESVGIAGGILLKPDAYECTLQEWTVPPEWTSAGSIWKYYLDGVIEWDGDRISSVREINNHTSTQAIQFLDGLCAPAYLVKSNHDLYTAPELEELRQKGIDPETVEITSEYWYVYFARPGEETGYVISLNAKNYTMNDIIAFAKSFSY